MNTGGRMTLTHITGVGVSMKHNFIFCSLLLTAQQGLAASMHDMASGQDMSHDLGLSNEPTPYLSDDSLPSRTQPLFELGEGFLSNGNIEPGFTLPTGAVWTPSLWVYGNLRSAYQVYEGAGEGDEQRREWATRLDLFANIQLSGTERILIGVTPLHDRDDGDFYGRIFDPSSETETNSEANLKIDTFFFEGDFAELFPNLDPNDSTANDIGFSIGRQNVTFMDGFILNDTMDGFGLSKNNVRLTGESGWVNLRSSIFIGLDDVHRGSNEDIDNSKLYGWFNQIDTVSSTYNIDAVYVEGDEAGDQFNLGIDATQRFGKLNTTFRAAFSHADGQVTDQANDGALLFMELSWVPAHTHDNAYFNAFVGIDQYTPAARGPLNGGPLSRTGLLFASQALGTTPSALNNSAQDASGFALGYQAFSEDRRQQFVIEAGARFEGDSTLQDEYGVAFRYQIAMGRRYIWQFDSYVTSVEGEDDLEYGTRVEFQIKF
jgi:hypothetical protein